MAGGATSLPFPKENLLNAPRVDGFVVGARLSLKSRTRSPGHDIGSAASIVFVIAVSQHLHLFKRNEAALYHFLKSRQEFIDFVFAIHDFDDQRQIFRQTQDFCGVQPARPAKAHRTAQHGGAGKMHLACFHDDGFIERATVEFIALTDENAAALVSVFAFSGSS